jgi:hypothetical protein
MTRLSSLISRELQDRASRRRHDFADDLYGMTDLRAFSRLLEEAAYQWRSREARVACDAAVRNARKDRAEGILGRQLATCIRALEALDARALLECVRAAALPGCHVTSDACIASRPADEALAIDSPVVPNVTQKQAAAASILTWGRPVPRGFVAVAVRGPVWWDHDQLHATYSLVWNNHWLTELDSGDDRGAALTSWLDRRLDNVIAEERDAAKLNSDAARARLEHELVEAVRGGVLRD